MAQIRNPAMAKHDLRFYGVSNFPTEWQENWLKSGYALHDPVVRYALRNRSAYTWQEARNASDKFGQHVHDTSRDFGLIDGLAIPITLGHRPPGVISLAHSGMNFSERELALIELVCVHAYAQFVKLTPYEEFDIQEVKATPREREILHYIAAGRTAEEVGKILSISETTVVKHLANLSLKLDTRNRIHTVATCIRSGTILP